MKDLDNVAEWAQANLAPGWRLTVDADYVRLTSGKRRPGEGAPALEWPVRRWSGEYGLPEEALVGLNGLKEEEVA